MIQFLTRIFKKRYRSLPAIQHTLRTLMGTSNYSIYLKLRNSLENERGKIGTKPVLPWGVASGRFTFGSYQFTLECYIFRNGAYFPTATIYRVDRNGMIWSVAELRFLPHGRSTENIPHVVEHFLLSIYSDVRSLARVVHSNGCTIKYWII